MDEYEDQRLLGGGGTSQSLRSLLEFYINDQKIDDEFRRKKLLQVMNLLRFKLSGESNHVII